MTNATHITIEPTPNPQSMKFVVGKEIAKASVDFIDADAALKSPLASKIFGFPWTAGVFVGRDFVTITKQDWVSWEVLASPLAGLIQEHIDGGEAVLLSNTSESLFEESDSEEVRRIKEILEYEVRPGLAADGGDIQFHKFENQIVYVYLQGACSSCASSAQTVKLGIEVRLKEAVPSVKEVIAL